VEWKHIEPEPEEQFCRVEHFEIRKGDVAFGIAVREYISPPDPAMRFFATADRQTNQRTAPYTPVGWGPNLGVALWECVQAIRRFPYEPLGPE
jgi:hypothetical protein